MVGRGWALAGRCDSAPGTRRAGPGKAWDHAASRWSASATLMHCDLAGICQVIYVSGIAGCAGKGRWSAPMDGQADGNRGGEPAVAAEARGEGERRALDGVRVLDLTHQVAGPSATLVLAFLGAEVVKVIAPGSRDSYDATPFYLNNASKKSVELDLKSQAGLATAKELAKKADIFVENFSPGVIDRLGLSWDVLKDLNPRLIYAQVKGFAEDSPYRDFPCFDPIAQGF